jgi:hypothetical protein
VVVADVTTEVVLGDRVYVAVGQGRVLKWGLAWGAGRGPVVLVALLHELFGDVAELDVGVPGTGTAVELARCPAVGPGPRRSRAARVRGTSVPRL